METISLSVSRSGNFKDPINRLYQSMKHLNHDSDRLICYLESDCAKAHLAEEDIITALQALQEAPTNYTLVFLQRLNKPDATFDNLLAAVNLVQIYLQMTQALDQILSNLENLDNSQDKYASVKTKRKSLQDTLTNVLDELNLTGNDLDIKILINESEELLKNVTAKKFIAHLKNAREILKILSSDSVSLTESQIKQLINNWLSGMQKLPNQEPKTEQERKQFVTQSLEIRSLLEDNYDLLAEILRFKDPLGFHTP